MRLISTSVDELNNIVLLQLSSTSLDSVIAEFNGVTVEGIKEGENFKFSLSIPLLDSQIIFKSNNTEVFKLFISKPRPFNNIAYEREYGVLDLLQTTPTFEGYLYTQDTTFVKSDDYDRGLNDGLILGQYI